MKESYWGYWLLVLGVFIIIVLLLVQSFTSTNTQDYYMVKTITEAAMEDAIDYSYFRTYGEAKINKEKFFESFLRRFAEEASLSTTYQITFSDVYEAPPKVSVKVASKAGGFSVVGDSADIDIVNKIDAILESSQFVSNTEKSSSISASSYTKYTILFDETRAISAADTNRYNELLNTCGTNVKLINNDDSVSKCTSDGSVKLKLYSCGYASDETIADDSRYDKNTVYCITHTTNTCVAIISLDNLTC